jgi:DNA-binding CsgD family transcriptional regulator
LKHFNVTSDGWRYGSLIAAFSLIGLLAAVDLLGDLDEGVSGYHLFAEGSVIVIALAATAVLIRALLARTHELNRRLVSSDETARAWRAEAESLLRGLGASIDRQFGRWHLSGAEKEVALLLLKGLSHKEIARARGIGEATARQQATAVYRKAGVEGRNDLAAFFLEDLALPRERSDTIAADLDAGLTRGARRSGSVGDVSA